MPCQLVMRDSHRDEKQIATKLSQFDDLGGNTIEIDEFRLCCEAICEKYEEVHYRSNIC